MVYMSSRVSQSVMYSFYMWLCLTSNPLTTSTGFQERPDKGCQYTFALQNLDNVLYNGTFANLLTNIILHSMKNSLLHCYYNSVSDISVTSVELDHGN